ncbi:MAG: VOC family protein [Kofleriaceae bacterium]|nr:VOC family protein [Kofleriaceae bacterium]
MQRVRGIGGVFFKAKDPAALARWYRDHLGVAVEDWGGARFGWADHDPRRDAATIWNPFPADTAYFAPSKASFMVNFRVDDLDAMLAQLRAAGDVVDDKVEDSEFGRFGWVMDPEGNRVELWQPA